MIFGTYQASCLAEITSTFVFDYGENGSDGMIGDGILISYKLMRMYFVNFKVHSTVVKFVVVRV